MTTKEQSNSSTRRDFLGRSALIISSTFVMSKALASEPLPKLKEDEPISLALGYKTDATQVDTTKYPKRAGQQGANQFCANCSLYKPETADGYGTCSAIPGKHVAGAGWCNAWVPGF